MIHRIRRQNPNAILIVTGCYAQLKPQEISHIDGVDYVLGQDQKFHLTEFIEQLENHQSTIPSDRAVRQRITNHQLSITRHRHPLLFARSAGAVRAPLVAG